MVAAEIGDVFDGCFPDPDHPNGWRYIEMWNKFDPQLGRWGVSYGSNDDPELGPEWNMYIWANKTGDDETITIDSSSTGDPNKHYGVFDTAANGIRWDDGSLWAKNDASLTDCKQHNYLAESSNNFL